MKLLISCFFAISLAYTFAHARSYKDYKYKDVAASINHACAITDVDVLCWSPFIHHSNYRRSYVIPNIKNAKEIVTYDRFNACVLTDEIIQCWEMHEYGPYNMKTIELPGELGTPTQLVSGYEHLCAMGNGRVYCWGEAVEEGDMISPNLSGVKQISSGNNHVCAIDQQGVVCWTLGNAMPLRIETPKGKAPLVLTSDRSQTCISFGDYNECVGFGTKAAKLPDVAKFSSTFQIAVGYKFECGIYDDGYDCWKNARESRYNMPIFSKKPKKVVTGNSNLCAITSEEHLHCYGVWSNADKVWNPPVGYYTNN